MIAMMMMILNKPLVKGHAKLPKMVAMVAGVDKVSIIHLNKMTFHCDL